MDNIKQFVIDYVEGRVKSDEFFAEIRSNSRVLDWIQSQVPEGKTCYLPDIVTRSDGSWYQKTMPYDIRYVIGDDILKQTGSIPLGEKLNKFTSISQLIMEIFPNENIQMSDELDQKFDFLLDACPEYLWSNEIENSGIFERILEGIPENISKSKKIKMFRETLKKMFYVEGQKYPRWIQDSEWPLSKTGKPTKFLRQKGRGEVSYYYFLDVDTNEEIEVMQAY